MCGCRAAGVERATPSQSAEGSVLAGGVPGGPHFGILRATCGAVLIIGRLDVIREAVSIQTQRSQRSAKRDAWKWKHIVSYIGVNGYQKSSAIVISSVWSPSANSSSFSDPQAGAGRGEIGRASCRERVS